jgi:putative ubiquitin-RnfH superfamily antitoxin RatB of RatAB toxin-antitoxin module
MSTEITVEVVYAQSHQQKIITFKVPVGTTVAEAIAQSRIAEYFPEIDPAQSKVGIFGRLTNTDTVLRDRDRVEIYRPLIADPKQVRRKRAESSREKKKSG